MTLYRIVYQRWEKSPAYPCGHWAFKDYLPVALPRRLAELRRDVLLSRRTDLDDSYLIEATR